MRLRLCAASLMALGLLSGCTSAPTVQQCPPLRPLPAELQAEPQSLIPLLDKLVLTCDVDSNGNCVSSDSAVKN